MPLSDDLILHVARVEDLERARESGRYRASSLDTEGFIHCCDPAQLPGVLTRHFGGSGDGTLRLLSIDTHLLDSPVVREDTVGTGERFPHVYGEIALGAVVEVLELGGTPTSATSGGRAEDADAGDEGG